MKCTPDVTVGVGIGTVGAPSELRAMVTTEANMKLPQVTIRALILSTVGD